MVEEDKRGIGAGHNLDYFIELTLADQARRIGPLPALNEGGRDGRTCRAREFLKLCTCCVNIEARHSIVRRFFISGHDGCCAPGEPSSGGQLFVPSKFAGELDHNNHREFLLRLRSPQFAR